jgi:hypothetical protein
MYAPFRDAEKDIIAGTEAPKSSRSGLTLLADFCLSPPTAMGCGFNRSTQRIGHTPIVLGYVVAWAGKARGCWL